MLLILPILALTSLLVAEGAGGTGHSLSGIICVLSEKAGDKMRKPNLVLSEDNNNKIGNIRRQSLVPSNKTILDNASHPNL